MDSNGNAVSSFYQARIPERQRFIIRFCAAKIMLVYADGHRKNVYGNACRALWLAMNWAQ